VRVSAPEPLLPLSLSMKPSTSNSKRPMLVCARMRPTSTRARIETTPSRPLSWNTVRPMTRFYIGKDGTHQRNQAKTIKEMNSMSCSRIGQAITVVALLLLKPIVTAQSDDWSKRADAGRDAHEPGDYTEAERVPRLAMGEVERLGEDDSRTAYVLDGLARLLINQSKFAEGKLVATRALKCNETASGPNSRELSSACRLSE